MEMRQQQQSKKQTKNNNNNKKTYKTLTNKDGYEKQNHQKIILNEDTLPRIFESFFMDNHNQIIGYKAELNRQITAYFYA